MPEWGYSISDLDPAKTVKSAGRELRVSHKHAHEVCTAIKGMTLEQARTYLNRVIAKKQPVPYRRYRKKLGHRHGVGQGAYAARYPTKTAKRFLQILAGAEANAEFKGLDIERLHIIHASAHPGMKLKRFIPRAMGRSSPRNQTLTHIELVLQEAEETAQ
jgi:large subunit ribosomal protein L22